MIFMLQSKKAVDTTMKVVYRLMLMSLIVSGSLVAAFAPSLWPSTSSMHASSSMKHRKVICYRGMNGFITLMSTTTSDETDPISTTRKPFSATNSVPESFSPSSLSSSVSKRVMSFVSALVFSLILSFNTGNELTSSCSSIFPFSPSPAIAAVSTTKSKKLVPAEVKELNLLQEELQKAKASLTKYVKNRNTVKAANDLVTRQVATLEQDLAQAKQGSERANEQLTAEFKRKNRDIPKINDLTASVAKFRADIKTTESNLAMARNIQRDKSRALMAAEADVVRATEVQQNREAAVVSAQQRVALYEKKQVEIDRRQQQERQKAAKVAAEQKKRSQEQQAQRKLEQAKQERKIQEAKKQKSRDNKERQVKKQKSQQQQARAQEESANKKKRELLEAKHRQETAKQEAAQEQVKKAANRKREQQMKLVQLKIRELEQEEAKYESLQATTDQERRLTTAQLQAQVKELDKLKKEIF